MNDWSNRSDLLDPKLIGADHDGVPTLWDAFLRGYCLAGPSSPCMGTRLGLDYSSHHPRQPRQEYHWLSYAQVFTKIRALSIGFFSVLGEPSTLIDPSTPPKNLKDYLNKPRLALWCSSSPSWTISEYAAYRNSMAVVSINDEHSAKTTSEIIQSTNPHAIVLNTHNFQRLIGYRDRWRRFLITASRRKSLDIEFHSLDSPGPTEASSSHQDFKTSSRQTPETRFDPMGFQSRDTPSRDYASSSRNSDRIHSASASGRTDSSSPLMSDPIYILTDPLQLSMETRSFAVELALRFYSLEEVESIGYDRIHMSLPIDAPDESLEPDGIIESEKANIFRPESRTIAAIVYSSGTTGKPKPCVLSHGNFAANLAALNHLVEKQNLKDLGTHDLIQFSYLPLYHIYEKQTQAYVLNRGGSIGYSSLESPRLLEDLSILKPTFMSTTPMFLTNQILDSRLQFLNNFSSFKNPIESYLLNKAIDQKLKMLKSGHGEHIWLWDRFVLGYLRNQLGGRLKWVVSGTSPLSKDVAELLSASLSVKISEGYGLTETCGAACIAIEDSTHDFQVGHVGPPLPCCEIKLEKVEGLAKTQNQFQEGLVHVRGHNVFLGYLVPRTSTVEERIEPVIDSEGWLSTGDVGFIDDRGRLHLIDRILGTSGQSPLTLPQQIHNQFHWVDLGQIERTLLNSIPEISQIFISSRLGNSHAEVGIGHLGTLVGFIVLEHRSFMRWIAENNQLNNQIVASRHDGDEGDGGHSCSEDKEKIQAGLVADREWELIDQPENLVRGTRNLNIEEELKSDRNNIGQIFSDPMKPTFGSSESSQSCSHHHHQHGSSGCASHAHYPEFDNMCRDPLIMKLFLQHLRRRGKAVGLKPNEMPDRIYLSTRGLDLAYDHRSDRSSTPRSESTSPTLRRRRRRRRSTGRLEAEDDAMDSIDQDDPQWMFLTLNSKNSRLIDHFCS